VQARGAIGEIAPLLADRSTLVVSGPRAWEAVRRGLAARDRLPQSCPRPELVRQSGVEELARLTDACARRGCRSVVAIGGGRAIDAGKACAAENGLPCHVVPTILGTDAACSSVSVLYDERGKFLRYVDRKRNPRQVIVDPEILLAGPPRYFAAGVAGALAVFFEAEELIAAGRFAGGPALTAHYLGVTARCRESFLALDPAAVRHPGRLAPGDLDDVVFLALWVAADLFENVGLSLAHAVYRALRALGLAEGDAWLHGELVGLGLLCQLRLCATHAGERERVRRFVRDVLHGTDWPGLARALRERRTPFEEALGACAIAENLTAPADPRQVLTALLETLDGLAAEGAAQSTTI